jgi:IS30 family transposase
MGGRKLQITPDHVAVIERMASNGATLDQIATVLEVSPRTLDNWLRRDDVRQCYARAKLKAVDQIAGALYAKALAGDVTCMIFYLKTQAGWREVKESQLPEGSQVIIYVPRREERP